MELIAGTVETDEGYGTRQGHDTNNQAEEHLLELPVICMDRICSQTGEVDRKNSYRDRDDQGVLKTCLYIKGLQFLQNIKVLLQILTRDQTDRVALDSFCGSCGVDQHTDERPQA